MAEFHGCITEEYRVVLQNMVTSDADKNLILGLLKTIPNCDTVRPIGGREKTEKVGKTYTIEGKEVSGRTPWPSVIYYNEKGEAIQYNSPTAAHKALIGEDISGEVCVTSPEGTTKCRALSIVDNFTLHGYIVRGNGEPPPTSTGRAVDVENAHQAWKQHLIATGKHFLIFDPKSPALQEAQEKAEKTTKIKKEK